MVELVQNKLEDSHGDYPTFRDVLDLRYDLYEHPIMARSGELRGNESSFFFSLVF